MILVLIAILPILSVLACLGFNRAVPTRLLGIGAALALLICGAGLLLARLRGGLPLILFDRPWMVVGNRPLQVLLEFDALNWAPALLGLWGGGLALLALALLVPANLRGFGGLFAAAQLAVVASVLGMANQSPLLLPFAWSNTALLAFLALRASGALAGSDAPVIVLLAGLSGALLALGVILALPGAAILPSSRVALAGWVVLSLLVLGAPPFQAPQQRLAEAPAALAGLLMTLGLPLLAGVILIRFWGGSAAVTNGWRTALTALGVLTLLVCAAGAVGATQLRRRLSWQFSAQQGLFLIALGRGGAVLAAAAPMLLASAVLATLVCFLAVALLERRAGTDDMAAIALREPLRWPGALYLVGAASAVGLPGFWGLWPRRWLIEDLLRTAPWAVAPLLAGSALLAATFVSALAVFWRPAAVPAAGEPTALRPERPSAVVLIGAVVALPLVAFGIAPQLVWSGWLAATPIASSAPALPGRAAQLACAAAALVLIAAPLVLRLGRGSAEVAVTTVVATSALGESLSGLAWFGAAASLFAGLWHGLLRGSRLLLRGLVLFEQRYYLAGLLIAVIVVIMLFIQ